MNLTRFAKLAGLERLEEGFSVVAPLNADEYPNRDSEGLEGPFRLKNGLVVYYDKREGKYYNPKTDIFLSHEEYQQYNESMENSMDNDRLLKLSGLNENFALTDERAATMIAKKLAGTPNLTLATIRQYVLRNLGMVGKTERDVPMLLGLVHDILSQQGFTADEKAGTNARAYQQRTESTENSMNNYERMRFLAGLPAAEPKVAVIENFTDSDEHVASEILSSLLKDRAVDREQVKRLASQPKQAFWLLKQLIDNGRDPGDYGNVEIALIYGVAKDQELNFQLAKLYQQNGYQRPNETHINLSKQEHRDELEKMQPGRHTARRDYEEFQDPKELQNAKQQRRRTYSEGAVELTAEDALNEGTMRDEVQALTAATARWKQAFESVVEILRNLDKNDPQSQKFLSTVGNLIRGIAQQSGEFESILKKSSGWISHPHHNVREGAVELTTEELANVTINEFDVETEIVAALAASIIAEESEPKVPELDNEKENAGKTSKVPSDVSSALNKRVSELKQSLSRYGDKGAKQNAVDALEKIADLLKLEDGLTDAAVFYGTLMSPITDLFPPNVVKFIHAAPKKVSEGVVGEFDGASDAGYSVVAVERLAKGEFVKRKPDASKVYRLAGYDRQQQRYILDDESDSSKEIAVKAGTMLVVGFSY